MGASSSSEKEEVQLGYFDACFTARKKGRREVPDDLVDMDPQSIRLLLEKLREETTAEVSSKENEIKDLRNQLANMKAPSKRGDSLKKELQDKDEYIDYLKSNLEFHTARAASALNEFESSNKTDQNDESIKRDQEIRDRNKEIELLKQELATTKLKAESTRKAARNAIQRNNQSEDAEESSDGSEQQEAGEKNSSLQKYMPQMSDLSLHINDTDAKNEVNSMNKNYKRRDRNSMCVVSSLDEQLNDGFLSLDEYALALSSLLPEEP